MIYTTLNRIRAHEPSREGWTKLLTTLNKTRADDEPLSFATILESNGLDDALWCCRAEPQHAKTWRLFAVWCARQVPQNDPRSVEVLNVAERHAQGQAAVWDAAWDAADRAADRAAAWDAQAARFLAMLNETA